MSVLTVVNSLGDIVSDINNHSSVLDVFYLGEGGCRNPAQRGLRLRCQKSARFHRAEGSGVSKSLQLHKFYRILEKGIESLRQREMGDVYWSLLVKYLAKILVSEEYFVNLHYFFLCKVPLVVFS